jgi:hypothetical protein
MVNGAYIISDTICRCSLRCESARCISFGSGKNRRAASGPRYVDKCELKPLGSTENGACFALRRGTHGLCVILSRLAEQKVTSCVAVETRFVVKVRDQQ